MRPFPDTLGHTGFRDPGARDLAVPGEDEPPGPLQLAARLGVLLAIALAFGLAAQVLVSVPH
jgi:hypothetical protein